MTIEHALIVTFSPAPSDIDALHDLDDSLRSVVDDAQIGEIDGYEWATDGSNATVYMYGPDARTLFEATKPILAQVKWAKSIGIYVRFGEAGDENAPESTFELGSPPVWP